MLYSLIFVMHRLEVFEYADCLCEISVIEETKKRNAAIPAYLGENGTLRYWLRTTLDIRSVPKKVSLCCQNQLDVHH